MGACCRKLTQLSYRDGETRNERTLKQMVVVPGTVIGSISFVYWFYWYWTTGIALESYRAGLLIAAIALMTPVSKAIITKRLEADLIRVVMISCSVGVVCMDWASASLPGPPRLWALNVLLVDILLVINSTPMWSTVLVSMTLLWLVISSTEEVWRWGLFRVDGWSTPPDEDLQEVLDCQDPPCGTTVVQGIFRFIVYSFVFVFDFYFTRGFANGLREQMMAVESSVFLAEEVAVLLAAYDTVAAQSLVDEGGATLPPRLQEAMTQLLENLRQYRPFLPQSCLPQQYDDEDEEAAAEQARAHSIRMAESDNDEDASTGSSSPTASPGWAPQGAGAGSPDRLPSVSFCSDTACNTMTTQQREADPTLCLSQTSGSPSSLRSPPVGHTGGIGRHRSTDYPGRQRSIDARSRRTRDRRVSDSSSGPRGMADGQDTMASSSIFGALDSMGDLRHSSMLPPLPRRKSKPTGAHGQALQRKHATFLVANVHGYLGAAMLSPPQMIVRFHEDVLSRFMQMTARAKGITELVSADRFMASFNGSRMCVGHKKAGHQLGWDLCKVRSSPADIFSNCRCGSRQTTQLSGTMGTDSPPGTPTAASAGATFSVSAGVASGELLCGNIGCDELRRYALIGPATTWAYILERLATRWPCPVLVNGPVRNDALHNFSFRLREEAKLRKMPDLKPTKIWETIEPAKEQAVDEWMYQLEKASESDPWKLYNQAKEALLSGNESAAIALLEQGRAKVKRLGQGVTTPRGRSGKISPTHQQLGLELSPPARRTRRHSQQWTQQRRVLIPGAAEYDGLAQQLSQHQGGLCMLADEATLSLPGASRSRRNSSASGSSASYMTAGKQSELITAGAGPLVESVSEGPQPAERAVMAEAFS
eukprot:TRINITY_DN70254_c0_g1_i1.p1 TRINITY_DN70254_c0_g1~~TRINITY_DN70254_c0_g1_i1.p1  ORF type:complete len:919 (+),score=169.06 TRINITY_DN70254_c0_g1_i1:128-2758(+)